MLAFWYPYLKNHQMSWCPDIETVYIIWNVGSSTMNISLCMITAIRLSVLKELLSSKYFHNLSAFHFPLFEFGNAWTSNLFCPLWIMWHWVSLEFHLILSFLFVLSFDSTWTSFKKTSTERVDPHPYSHPLTLISHSSDHLSLCSPRFNNSYNRWESPPKNVFITQVPGTEILTIPSFFIQCQQLTGFQSQMQCQFK